MDFTCINLNALCSDALYLVKEVSLERLPAVQFHLCDIPERARLQGQKTDQWLPGAGGGDDNKGIEGVWQVTKFFCILIMVVSPDF